MPLKCKATIEEIKAVKEKEMMDELHQLVRADVKAELRAKALRKAKKKLIKA